MSLFTSIRDALESVAVVAGNYFAPGSSILTSHLVSEGSQQQLGSPLGQLVQLGSGITGGVQGNSIGGLFKSGAPGGIPGAEEFSGDYPVYQGAEDFSGTAPNPAGAEEFSGDSPFTYPTPDAATDLIGNPEAINYRPPVGTGIPGGPTPESTGMPPTPGSAAPTTFQPQLGTAGTPVGTAAQRALYSIANPTMRAMTQWAGSTGVQPWGSPGNIMSMGSGLYGMYQSEQLRKMAALARQDAITAGQKADPWGQVNPATGTSGRAVADTQLQTLMKDPSGITKMPGYQAGMEAVMRSMAAQGYTGSGNMMAALQKYGGDFYSNAINQLSGLSGATVNPGTGASISASGGATQIQGNIGANDLASQSLRTLGYGVTRTQPNQLPSWMQ